MASIVDNFGGRALQLGNEEFVRKMQFGNDWNYLRLGVRLLANGTSNITTARFQLGVCDGDVDTFASPNCIQYVGSLLPFGDSAWTYNAGGYYVSGSVSITSTSTVRKESSTITTNQTAGALSTHIAAASSGRCSIYLTDINRLSATSVSIRQIQTDSTAILTNMDFYNFIRSMEIEVPTGTAGVSALTTARTLTSLVSTHLDTFSIYWNHSTPTLEINDICALRFY